jgi:hypothetical protein
VPLVAAEFAKAAISFPIAWVKSQDSYDPVGLLGLEAAENLFVNSAGQWVGEYMPAHFRLQPFRLMADGGGRLTLGVREDCDLVTNDASGEAFFTEGADLSVALSEIVEKLQKIEANRAATARATAALADAGLLQPWQLSPTIERASRRLEGLYHISQERLNALDADALVELKELGALGMAYCQQVSQQLIGRLESLHAKRASVKMQRSTHPADRVGFGLDDQDSGISFGGMHDEPSDGDPSQTKNDK